MEEYKLKRKSARIVLKTVTQSGLVAIPIVNGVLTDESGINEVYPGELLWNSADGVLSTIDTLGNTVTFNVTNLFLSQLNDIDFSTLPTDGQILKYNEVSQVWQPADESGGSTYTFSDGITESGGTVKLGGTLSADTTIDADGNTLTLSSNGATEKSYILVNDTSMFLRHYSDANTDQSSISLNKDSTSSFALRQDGVSVGVFLIRSTKPYLSLQTAGGALDPVGNSISIFFKGDGGLHLTDTNNVLNNYITGALDGTLMPKRYVDKNIMNNGITANRPSTPENYEQYFDTTLGKPIVYNGTNWIDFTGTTV